MTKSLIEGKELFFRYDENADWTLKNLNFSVYEGEWLAVVGHNGSGKSTLAKLLNGLLLPDEGTIHVEGFSTKEEKHLWEIRRTVGVVFQNPDNQFVATTVRDDVAFGLENHGVPREEMIVRLEEAIEKVGMTGFEKQEPHRLSGGQKQRVAIAGVLAVRPSIIILDEATSMLDPIGKKEVIETVRALNREEGVTVLSITHDLNEALLADRMFVMNRGEMIQTASPREIFRQGDQLLDIGLDLPFSIKIREKLIEKGAQLSGHSLTQDELVDELWTLQSSN
jgi:energy-coupling factor transport system ATP-binding protein